MTESIKKKYNTFNDFYPFYLSEHSHPINRILHFIGTTLALGFFLTTLYLQKFSLTPLSFLFGYAFAWIGHFCIEKNRPATFTYPLYSFRGDFKMWFELLTFKRSFF